MLPLLPAERAPRWRLKSAHLEVCQGQRRVGCVFESLVRPEWTDTLVAHQDLLSGRVDLFFDNAATAKAYIDDGRVKAFAVSSGTRFPGLPDLPTVGGTGVASMELESWFGIFGRSGTPVPVIERLRAEMAKAVQSPGFVARFEKSGGRMLRMSPAEADAFVRAENAKWSRLIREAGITAE